MKKLVSILLLAALLLGLGACGGGEDAPATTAAPTAATEAPTANPTTAEATAATEAMAAVDTFSAGFARIDITPQTSVPLAGGSKPSDQRMSKEIRDYLYATAIALADGKGNTVLFLTMDLQRAANITTEAVRPIVSEQTGIPMERVIFSGTHTHSGPDLHNPDHPAIIQYIDFLNPRLVQVCMEALADLKPTQMYVGSVETENLNFVKHYQYVAEDGTTGYFGDHFGTATYNETTRHTTEVDPTMHLMQLKREGQKDIILINWRAHPNSTAGSYFDSISADYPGGLRMGLENEMDCVVAYFQGACGNLNSTSRLTEEMRTKDMLEHGYLLSQHAMEGLQNNMTPVEVDTISTRQTILDQPVNHTMDHLFYKAKEVRAYWSATGDGTGANAMARPYGIRGYAHAGAIVGNYGRGATKDVELDAIVFGEDVAIVTAPNELFDTNSVWLEENSPYRMTMTFGYTNGYRGYIPSALAWEYTCYESDCSWFLPGTGEQFQQVFLDMLTDIKTNG